MERHFNECDQARKQCPFLDCDQIDTCINIEKQYQSCQFKKFYCWNCKTPRTKGPHCCVAELQQSLCRVQDCLQHYPEDKTYVLEHTELGIAGFPVCKRFNIPTGYTEALRYLIDCAYLPNLDEMAHQISNKWQRTSKSQDSESSLSSTDEPDSSHPHDSSNELHFF